MQYLSLNKAAKTAHKTKKTIQEDIDNGTLSATKNDRGHWQIDPAELSRVYNLKTTDLGQDQSPKPMNTTPEDVENRIEIERLKAELQASQKLTDSLADQVSDLRERLDKEGEERRALTAMLTDQRGQGEKRGFLGLFSRA